MSDAAQADAQPPSEPEMIEVWRPSRREGQRRVRDHKKEARTPAPPPTREDNAQPTAAAPAPAAAPSHGDARQRSRQDSRRRKPEHRLDRPQRDRPVKRFERREKMPDPNSPFAKLASLKAQLEADAKERPKDNR
jgi:ATP-dependent RNA helicase SUPV3L1/SUV3